MFDFSATTIIARLLVLFTAIPIHEFAHAYAAGKMGDPTARYRNRVSLNPFDHIDPIGAMMIMLFGIGFARPVPINSLNFRDRKKGIIITSLAGPLSNVGLALVCLVLFKLVRIPYLLTGFAPLGFVVVILNMMVSINLTLAVFNLLPIPPLDGWNVVSQLLPSEIYWKISQYHREFVFGVLFLIMFGFFDVPIRMLSSSLYFVIDKLTFFIDFLAILVV